MTAHADAVVLRGFGEGVELIKLPVPPPVPGGLIVDVTHGGICGTDVHLQRGHLKIPVPLVLGHEGLGVIRSLGGDEAIDMFGSPIRGGRHGHVGLVDCLRRLRPVPGSS